MDVAHPNKRYLMRTSPEVIFRENSESQLQPLGGVSLFLIPLEQMSGDATCDLLGYLITQLQI